MKRLTWLVSILYFQSWRMHQQLLTFSNRHRIMQQLAVHDVILSRLASVQDLQAGLAGLGILKLASKHPEIKSMLVLSKSFTSQSFEDLFSLNDTLINTF